MHLKKLIKTGEFLCSHFNIEDGRKHTFFNIMLYYCKKGKNTTEMENKICAVFGEDAVTDQMCQKWFVKFQAGDFSLNNDARPVEVDSNQIETLTENNQCYTMQEIANILKISKLIMLLMKIKKCVFYFMEKKLTGLLGQLNTHMHIPSSGH